MQSDPPVTVTEVDGGTSAGRRLMSRRELIASTSTVSAAVTAGLAVQTQALAQAQTTEKQELSVPKVKLGKTGMMVSRLACGGSWDIDQEVLALAYSIGINYIDTAESYRDGQSERLIGQFLKTIGATGRSVVRKKMWLVTKSHDHRQFATKLSGSLDRLQQEYVDCVFMHQIRDPKLALDPDIRAQAASVKKSGKSRFFGFSVHDEPVVECLNAAADSDFIDVIMFRYDCHYYPREDLMKAIDRCHAKGIGLVAMKTVVGGMTLPDRFDPFKKRGLNQHQAAIKAVAIDPRIHAICSEMTTTDMITQNGAAVASRLTVAEAEAVKEHATLISHLWCRGCDHICRSASGAGQSIAVADTLRFLMYHDHYGKKDQARDLYQGLSFAERDPETIQAADWHAAERACPYDLPLAKLMRRAQDRLT